MRQHQSTMAACTEFSCCDCDNGIFSIKDEYRRKALLLFVYKFVLRFYLAMHSVFDVVCSFCEV